VAGARACNPDDKAVGWVRLKLSEQTKKPRKSGVGDSIQAGLIYTTLRILRSTFESLPGYALLLRAMRSTISQPCSRANGSSLLSSSLKMTSSRLSDGLPGGSDFS